MIREAVRHFLLGSADVPSQCVIGLTDPQSDVQVWLEEAGARIDVTDRNIMAAASPLLFGIGRNDERDQVRWRSPVLVFRGRKEENALAEIHLRHAEDVVWKGGSVALFHVTGSANYCVPALRLRLHYWNSAIKNRRAASLKPAPELRLDSRELRAVFAFYVCPRPVVLVSVEQDGAFNIFPMDLIGAMGQSSFALALHNTSVPLQLVQASGRIAVSSVPMDHCAAVLAMGRHHNARGIDVKTLPFATMRSHQHGLAVPQVSLRVREMQVHTIRRLGSHHLLIAEVLQDRTMRSGLQMFQAHGFYRVWKSRVPRNTHKENISHSLAR